MKKELKVTPGIFPMPVLMIGTYNEDGSVDVMNAAWGMAQSMNQLKLCLTESHKTVKNMKRTYGQIKKKDIFQNYMYVIMNMMKRYILQDR